MTKRFISIIIMTAFAFLTCIVFLSGGGQASAYTETVRLSIEHIGPFYPYYSGKTEDGDKGGEKLLVKCNKDTDELTYEADYFTNIETGDVTNELLTANPETPDEYKYVIISFFKNGNITFTATMDKGGGSEGEESEDYEVKRIDNVGPRLDKTQYPVPTREGINLKWTVNVTDDNFASHSANSGLKEIVVFCYDETATFDQTEPLDSLDLIFVRKRTKEYQVYTAFHAIEFTMDQNGRYFVYMKDNIGNIRYEYFGDYTDVPEYYVMLELYGEERRVPVEMALYESYLTEGKGKVNQAILNDLRAALDNFITVCQLERGEEEKKEVYFVLKNAVEAYSAAEIKREVAITNPELLDGALYPVNLDSVTSLLPGDKLELAVLVTSYNQSDLQRFAYAEVLTLAGVSSPDKILRLSYGLIKNNTTLKPSQALLFHIEIPEGATVSLVVSADNNNTFATREVSRDKNTVQFSSTESKEEFYFVIRYSDTASNGLVIGLSVGGGALLAVIIVLAVLYKKGKLHINHKANKETVDEIKNEDADGEDFDELEKGQALGKREKKR